MKLLLACALVACAAASSLRKDDHYAPKYEGFDGNKFGTITLFAKGAEKDAATVSKDMEGIIKKDHDHGYAKEVSMFKSSPLASRGFDEVKAGKHGFVFENGASKKEVYCQRDARAEVNGEAVDGGAATKFEFHCAEVSDAEKARFKS